MKKQTLWRVRYEVEVGKPAYHYERAELLAADTMEDALRLARALPTLFEVKGVENYGWCWA